MNRMLAAAVITACAPCLADPAIHYAPVENLEHIDVALIDRAEHEIDMAAYVLTDWPVIQALRRAADRGVKVRIYLDGTQVAEHARAPVFNDLRETPSRNPNQDRHQRANAPQELRWTAAPHWCRQLLRIGRKTGHQRGVPIQKRSALKCQRRREPFALSRRPTKPYSPQSAAGQLSPAMP